MIGAVTYTRNPRFSIVRAYPIQIGINAAPFPAHNPAPGVYTLEAPGASPYVLYTFKIAPQIVAWSTAAYTLDFVLKEAYYSFPPFTVNNPADVTVNSGVDPISHRWSIVFGAFGYGGDPVWFPLAGAPPTYWNQPA